MERDLRGDRRRERDLRGEKKLGNKNRDIKEEIGLRERRR